jgi:hypothetical protein
MIPALKLPGPNVAIRFQPANDGTLDGALACTHGAWAREQGWPRACVPDCFGRPVEIEALTLRDAERGNDRREALLRKLVVDEAARVGLELQPGEVACRIQIFRDRFRLDSTASMQAFLDHAGITFEMLASVFRAEALVERMEQLCEASIAHELKGYRAFLAACATSTRRAAGDANASVDAMMAAMMAPSRSEKALRRQVLLGMLAARAVARRGGAVLSATTGAVAESHTARLRSRQGDDLRQGDEPPRRRAFVDLGEDAFAKRIEELAAITTLAHEGAAAIDEGLRLADAVRSVTTLPRRAMAAS